MDYRIYQATINLMLAIKEKRPSIPNDNLQCLIYCLIEQFAEDVLAEDNDIIEYLDKALVLIDHYKTMSQN